MDEVLMNRTQIFTLIGVAVVVALIYYGVPGLGSSDFQSVKKEKPKDKSHKKY